MKLVDILARELKVWPDALGHAVGQSADGTLHCEMEPAGTEIVWTSEKYTVCKKYMSDCVTRAEWQAAVDALNALKVVEWSGVGLPPIGMASCEYLGAHQYDEWTVVNIFAHYGHTVFVDFGDGWRAEKDSSRFRPIKTAEQLAEEEIQAIRDEIRWKKPQLGPCPVAQLYHKGYRKQ